MGIDSLFCPFWGADFGSTRITASAWLVQGLRYHPFATSLHYYFAVVVTCVTYFTHNKEDRDKEKSLHPASYPPCAVSTPKYSWLR